jgi:hypothetical protein
MSTIVSSPKSSLASMRELSSMIRKILLLFRSKQDVSELTAWTVWIEPTSFKVYSVGSLLLSSFKSLI